MIYGYNGDNDDDTRGGVSLGVNPPAIGIKLLNDKMSVTGIFNNAGGFLGDPTSDIEYWNNMNARWKDGSNFTYGGNGYGGIGKTNFIYSANPTDINGWSEVSENTTPGDRRVFMSSDYGIFSLENLSVMITLYFIQNLETILKMQVVYIK